MPQDNRTIYQVSELVAQVRDLLEHSFPLLWVEGEISNFSRPRSGHWYFTLKDGQAQVRCAMFRNRNMLCGTPPADGDRVLIRARISLYAARGDFQLIAEGLEAAGDGALRRAFEELKAKLQAEGLFDEASKKPLPTLPRSIGIITSATGAALQDICSVLQRRYPLGRIIVYPAPVQGDAAAAKLIEALRIANVRKECDVLILGRGGGSLEDLQAFNDETLARAIHASAIPVVSAVGHEVDFSIADFVADLRAATPTAAAELVAPDQQAWQRQLQLLQQRLARQWSANSSQASAAIVALQQRLLRQHPGRRLETSMQRLDEAEQRIARCLRIQQSRRMDRVLHQQHRLRAASPVTAVRAQQLRLAAAAKSIRAAVRQQHKLGTHRLGLLAGQLDAISPLRTLERGYAIASDPDGRIVTDAARLQPGDGVTLRLHKGSATAEIKEISPK